MTLFKPKKKKKLLYEKFVEMQKNNKNEVPQVLKKDNKRTVNKYTGPISIFICSLETYKGTGSTHLAATLNTWISHYYKKKAIVISDFDISKVNEAYGQADYVIFDCGSKPITHEIQSELNRAHIKIMMCKLEEEYLKKLADFISKESEIIHKWIFFFNFVPKSRKSEIFYLMEDYKTYILPLYDNPNKNKIVERIFKEVF